MSDPVKVMERTIPAGEFKAKCLRLLDEVAATGETLLITKRGKVYARLGPPTAVEARPFRSIVGLTPGIQIFGDIVGPMPEEWTLPEWMRE